MLRFHNGKFKIMQLADIQDTHHTSPDTLNFIRCAIKSESPDLVVLSGDQLKGYGFWFAFGNKNKNGKKALRNILAPIAESGISFAYTFGNHDELRGFSKAEQDAFYASYPSCVNGEGIPLGAPGCVCLRIFDESGKAAKAAVALIDTNAKNASGDYTGARKQQIKSCAEACADTPSIVFQHIPVREMYDLLVSVDKHTKGAVKGHRARSGEYFVLPDEMLGRSEYMRENIACETESNGQFDSWLGCGVMGAYFGHDHINCFTGTLKGINLGYAPGCGFNVYGPGLDRAVRIVELCESVPEEYKTYTVTYRDVCGKKLKRPLKCFMYSHSPSSVETAVPFFLKWLTAASVAGAAALLIAKYR